MDRIDITVEVPALAYDELEARPNGESSQAIRARVNQARLIQQERYAGMGFAENARMSPAAMLRYCALDAPGSSLMRAAFDTLGLTARSYDRILRVARTIADLDGCTRIGADHLAEAIQYRSFQFDPI